MENFYLECCNPSPFVVLVHSQVPDTLGTVPGSSWAWVRIPVDCLGSSVVHTVPLVGWASVLGSDLVSHPCIREGPGVLGHVILEAHDPSPTASSLASGNVVSTASAHLAETHLVKTGQTWKPQTAKSISQCFKAT